MDARRPQQLICNELQDEGDALATIAKRAPEALGRELAKVIGSLRALHHRAADLQTAYWLRLDQVNLLRAALATH